MIKEIVQFTQNLSEDFKNLGIKPKEGLHIVLKLIDEDDTIKLDIDNAQYERYTKKTLETEFLKKCKFWSINAWCIDTNKCFDLPTKAIHSCSPICVAFKREHLAGGAKYLKNQQEKKKQLDERFGDYFKKALVLLSSTQECQRYKVFESFFTQKRFEQLLEKIEIEFAQKGQNSDNQINALKQIQSDTKDKTTKEGIKAQIESLEKQKESFRKLDDSDYIIFYLDESLEKYKEVHQKYLADKLFNTSLHNTKPNEDNEIYGTSNFFNGFNQSMPFLSHQTATFEITGRISDKEAKFLYEFEQVLPRKILPNPLPIFVFKEELQKEVIGLFKESGFKLGFKETIESLWDKYQNDFANYYLLFYANTKDGLVFKDFDFVSKFEYELKDRESKVWQIEGLFDVSFQAKISNVFDFQSLVMQIIFNNNLIVKTKEGGWIYKYFDDLEEKYCKSSRNYLIILQYRKAFYDFIYKSQKQSITKTTFDDIMKTSILEDIRLDEVKNGNHSEYFNIRKKLNIWFSLYEKFDFNFNPINKTMSSKLTEYRQFIKELAEGKADISDVSVEQFAFASGQVIYYILQKSKSADQSYQRLEPYLQQVKCEEFKKAIANDFAKYKHENYSKRFENVASVVLTYQTDTNLKKVLPEILAGVFSDNLLFS